MPVTPTYPGVYIEETSSGVRTIVGVSTSITAFVGRALRGPVDEPVSVTNFGDFERIFGGLWGGSSSSFAVRDFFLNGGTQAIVVRLFHETSGNKSAVLDADTLILEAANPGAWGNSLKVRVDHSIPSSLDDGSETLFNLSLKDESTGKIEEFRNLSTAPDHARAADRVLANSSKLATVKTLPATRPNESTLPTDPDADPWSTAYSVDAADESSDGGNLDQNDFTGSGKAAAKTGMYALDHADLINLLCIPPFQADGNVPASLMGQAAAYCEKRRAILVVDPRAEWDEKSDITGADLSTAIGTNSKNAALFFPRIKQANPLRENQLEEFAPCGAVAGVIARTDAARGVWKAPAGLDASLTNVSALSVELTDAENGELNPLGVNCLRNKPPAGRIIWGSRTLQGDDRLASEWKYLPVRRLALHIEETLYRGSQWAVFEPNDAPLWSQIRLSLGSFMHGLYRQGAFQGGKPSEAYFVKCDAETTIQDDIDRGIVNIVVGFAPLKPAEFVIVKIQQIAGQSA